MLFDRFEDEPQDAPPLRRPEKESLRKMLREAVANTGGVPTSPVAPAPSAQDDRRFKDKHSLDSAAVRSLPANHPALVENRTLFPSTVVNVDENFEERLLVSGKNNRKLGERIQKGKFKGYALYGLSLEERATCPADCGVRAFCYGNGMQLARRHRIADLDLFNAFLEDEIRTILADPIEGLMIRLHVLGDFPSTDYVAMWADLLDAHENLACYGYTHRRPKKQGGDDVGDAIAEMKIRFDTRFRIRWSGETPQADGAIVIDHVPTTKRIAEGLVCPAQTDATACCATCGICWEGHAKKDTVVFLKHGPKSLQALAGSASVTEQVAAAAENIRPIAAINVPQKRDAILSRAPVVRIVDPTSLKVEQKYQRDLSGKSMRLIRKIVTEWDWAKFKPPICAETEHGLFVIDGQHTAIAAASRPEIKEIPVMIVAAAEIERRAEAFVAHNRDRLVMTPAQVFYGEVAAGDKAARAILEIVTRAGATIPRLPVPRNYAKPGQITAIGEIRRLHSGAGADLLERVVRIATISKVAPISATVVSALRILLSEGVFSKVAGRADVDIAGALASMKNIEATSQHYAAETGQSRFRAAAALIANVATGDAGAQ